MLEPAVDGPPSPERLRQLSKQAKRSSHLNRPSGHRSVASGSSPRAAMDGRPQWEVALENMSLSRQPSNRSAESSAASREALERDGSLGIGKSFFQRTGMSKRASSAHSSSNSSMHSGELASEDGGLKESLMPIQNLFARRKPSRDETSQKKLQISGPFNFQHVTHHQRDNLQTLQGGSRMDLASELSTVPTPGPATAPGVLKGIEAQDIYLINNSTESLDVDVPVSAPLSRPQLVPRHTAPAGPRRVVRAAKSSDQLRMSPTRPARPQSPIFIGNSDAVASGPVPPPRGSSRQSLMPDGFGAHAATSPLDRPRTSGGFRQPQPFSPDESFAEEPPLPPATSHGYAPTADFEFFGSQDEVADSHAISTPDDASWPLATPLSSYDKVLPDVPEEDEHHHHGVSRRSRVSLASIGSLRASQSVPMLRSFSQSQRRPSGASDTLGRLDLVAAQRAMRDVNEEGDDDAVTETPHMQENWEDCIDYCYEHEADANFDYQWERPSMDVSRDPAPQPSVIDMLDDELAEASNDESLPGIATTTPLDEASRSLSSTPYDDSSREVATSSAHLSVTNNFSLPRGDKAGRLSQLKSMRPISYASSFRESHGFNLSPSLLIPGDYHQQMLMNEAEKYDYHGDDEVFREAYQGPYHEDLDQSEMDRSPISCEQRSSTSTAETSFSSERHISANSTFTTMTRLTVSSSSTSLNKQAGVVTESQEPMPVTQIIDAQDEEFDDPEPTPPATKDTVPELTPFPMTKIGNKPHHRSHASESVARAEMASLKSQDPKFRRPRARTSSLSAQIAPPVGQYALFPRAYKAVGDRI